MRKIQNGDVVQYVDAHGVEHNALVTAAWGQNGVNDYYPEVGMLAINIVYVCQNAGARDQWGQQLIHESSVVHRAQQSAHGKYWYQK